MNEWIRVEDHLPELFTDVIVAVRTDEGHVTLMAYRAGEERWQVSGDIYGLPMYGIEYWMPPPPPPGAALQ